MIESRLRPSRWRRCERRMPSRWKPTFSAARPCSRDWSSTRAARGGAPRTRTGTGARGQQCTRRSRVLPARSSSRCGPCPSCSRSCRSSPRSAPPSAATIAKACRFAPDSRAPRIYATASSSPYGAGTNGIQRAISGSPQAATTVGTSSGRQRRMTRSPVRSSIGEF